MQEVIVHIDNNEITNKKAVSNFFKGLKDGKYLLSAKSIKKRSLNQNAYYWLVCGMIRDRMNELGNEVDSDLVHDFLKDRFNSKELTVNGVNIGSIGDTTTKLTTIEFEEYMEKIKRFAAEILDLYIPDPQKPMVMFCERDFEHNATIVTR